MAKRVFLEFEHDIEAFEKKVDELRELAENTSESAVAVSIDAEVAQLENKSRELLKKVYADLTPWQMSLVARHPNRPYTLDYIDMMFTDFQELHGDRAFADDEAIVGGLARLADMNVIVIGNQKGRTLRERTRRNFGMARPEGYRKALRLMKLAEKFGLPVITFVDTPGAYPGIDAEERGQSEAIGHNIYAMSTLNVPIVSCVIGEGGSGGALAIAVADTVMMLQVLDLLGHQSRGLRVHSLQGRRPGPARRRGARPDGPAPLAARPRRPRALRAARRRPPRSQAHGDHPQEGSRRRASRPHEARHADAARTPRREARGLRPLRAPR